MNESIPRIRPQALADYLWHRYQIRPGQAMCLALGQPDTRDNHEALVAWAREAIERYRIKGPEDLVNLIEGDLFEQMFDAGLVGGMVEMQPVPDPVATRLFGAPESRHVERTGTRAQHPASHSHSNKVVDFAGRSRHE